MNFNPHDDFLLIDSEDSLNDLLAQGCDDAAEAVAAALDPGAHAGEAELIDSPERPDGGFVIMQASGRRYFISWKFLDEAEERLRKLRERSRRIQRTLDDIA